MQTIANSELVRIFMQRKLQNYQKKKMEKKNEQRAKPCCSCAPCVNSWAKHGMMGRMLLASSLPGPNLASWAKPCCSMGKTGISHGRFPGQIRDPLIRSKNHSNRFRYRIRRIFSDFFPNPFFPEKMISGREFWYSVSVSTGISHSRFHPYIQRPEKIAQR